MARNSVAKATKVKTWDPNSEEQWKQDKAAGGAAWAQTLIDGIRVDEDKYGLQSFVGDAEKLFAGKPDELDAFYRTLQTAIVATKSVNLSEAELKRICADISMVSNLVHSVLELAVDITEVEVAGIEALCEKAGAISDRCAVALGGFAARGSWERWARAEWPAVEGAGEASHG